MPYSFKLPLFIALCFCLLSCASGKPPAPYALRAATSAARSAAEASRAGAWRNAAAQWADTARRFALLDDWREAGYATLGEAQALDHLGDAAAAGKALQSMLDSPVYPAEVKAEAAYQRALLAIKRSDWAMAEQGLVEATRLMAAGSPLQAAIMNAYARMAATRGDWQQARQHAVAALALPQIEAGERANALRRQAEATWRLGDAVAAVAHLQAALQLDRELARSGALREDNCLMASLMKENGAAAEAQRYAAVCAAMVQLQAAK